MENSDQFWTSYAYLRPYHPYRIMGQRNPAFTRTDRALLNLKEGNTAAIGSAAQDLTEALIDLTGGTPVSLAIIPGHEASSSNGGRPLQKVIAAMAAASPEYYLAAGDLITRYTDIPKRSHGANRSEDVHIRTLRIDARHVSVGHPLVIIDDVATTGNSIVASRKLASAYGYSRIGALVIGQTTY
jgi:predicted amidophosphoribosyltransferase